MQARLRARALALARARACVCETAMGLDVLNLERPDDKTRRNWERSRIQENQSCFNNRIIQSHVLSLQKSAVKDTKLAEHNSVKTGLRLQWILYALNDVCVTGKTWV